MWTVRCSRLNRLLLFLLAIITTTCTGAESGFVLKSVELHVTPADPVERGTELMLTCIANVGHSGTSPILRFSFFKDYNKHNSVHISQTNTSNKVTYSISKARASHSGNYQCDVTVNGQNMESSNKMISVKGLQTPVLSVDKQDVTEGGIVKVHCRAEEESGDLIFFIKNGSSELYHGTSSSGDLQWNLELKHVGTSELSCSYAIRLPLNMLRSNSSNVVSVVVRELDFKPTIRVFPSEHVIEGDSVHISCGLAGDYNGSLTLSLFKGSHLFQTGNVSEYKTVVKANDSGSYECSAIKNNVIKSVHANLTVKELFSTPVLTITPAEVFEGQQFTVTCSSSEFASERIGLRDVRYSIYRNDQELGSSDSSYTGRASSGTDGNYTCTARVNDTVKTSDRIDFIAKVLISKPNITALGEVILGRSFQMECRSDRGSFPITYTLKRNDIVLAHTSVSKAYQKAIFHSSIQHENQIQEFRCEAQNNGNDSAQMSDALLTQVTVPVQKPTLMTLPEDINENDEVNLLCFVMKGSPPISFKWYKDDNRSPFYTVTAKANFSTYNVPLVKSIHSGSYHCEALNGAGNVEVSNMIPITVKMARWKKGLIVGVCVLCAIAIILPLLRLYWAKRVKVTSSNGAGIWSERPPALDSSGVMDVEEPEEPNVEYTEVLHLQMADPEREFHEED
ncbi:platelet endothelial cell adhesion molecule isoform X2 [Tachysurus fulvidraco]|uniref:platelet endothelial cell adhesion molecule isoform X2 n=1 Tax=Tachysurus fulvidraco TaxID=1234273 RepID=UPI001FF05D31|nr:platelet endothelial cell adhesion molecule isoform X2 [Tachysurus fulvidraco]